MGWYFIRVCFAYTKMGGYESFFCKSAMPVVQSLRAQKGIKNLSEKKYEVRRLTQRQKYLTVLRSLRKERNTIFE